MLHRRVFVFIDNVAARAALVKMSSTCEAARTVLKDIAGLDAGAPGSLWFARVPSASSIADKPSRPDFSDLSRAARVHLSFKIDEQFVEQSYQQRPSFHSCEKDIHELFC